MNTDTGTIYWTPEGVEAAKERGERIEVLEEAAAREMDKLAPEERLNRAQRRRQQFGKAR